MQICVPFLLRKKKNKNKKEVQMWNFSILQLKERLQPLKKLALRQLRALHRQLIHQKLVNLSYEVSFRYLWLEGKPRNFMKYLKTTETINWRKMKSDMRKWWVTSFSTEKDRKRSKNSLENLCGLK